MYAGLRFARIKDEMVPDLHAEILPEGRILAGFSGGADSTALILLLAAERDAGRIETEAVHVNHGLRGAESDADEAFCRTTCERLRIPLHVVRADLRGKTDENACREARFGAFESVLKESGIRVLALGHNRDDVAETFLMRLMRGAGPDGLSCMSAADEREGYVIRRPLVRYGREEIRAALRNAGETWREDSSNRNEKYLRNSVREQLLPIMERLAPGAAGRIARTSEILNDEIELLQEEAERFLKEHSAGIRIDPEALRKVPPAMRTRILRTWWKRNAPELREHSLNAEKTEELAALADAERGKINLPGRLYAVKGKNGIYLTGFPKQHYDEIPYRECEIRFGKVTLRTLPSERGYGNGITEQEVPRTFLRGCVIRTRRPGDRIRPFGMSGTRKLQDYLTDKGVDEPWRDEIPLLCREEEVLFAAGVGAGAVPDWNADEDNVRLRWEGDLPWKQTEREEKPE